MICVSLFILCSNPSLYNGDDELPVYRWNQLKEHYTLDSLGKLCTSHRLCHPLAFAPNSLFTFVVSFVVDLHELDDPVDVRADENGVWVRKGSPVAYVSMHTKKGKTRFFRRTKKPTQPHQFKITRTYYRHASSPDFTRMIAVAHSKVLLCLYM